MTAAAPQAADCMPAYHMDLVELGGYSHNNPHTILKAWNKPIHKIFYYLHNFKHYWYRASTRATQRPAAAAHKLIVMAAIFAKQATPNHDHQRNFVVDADSKPLGIDNRCTAFISGDINDFHGPLQDTDKVVRGFGGTRVAGVKRGTAIIRLEDDQGAIHKFQIPNSYYVPGSPDRLFSPQHWAQERTLLQPLHCLLH